MEWAHSNGYGEGLTIDRVNNNGSYRPDNCRWVTQQIQLNNTRRSKMLTYKGKRQSMADWARELKINYYTLRSRIRIGWPVKKAIQTMREGSL